jgi:hypothetical protein
MAFSLGFAYGSEEFLQKCPFDIASGIWFSLEEFVWRASFEKLKGSDDAHCGWYGNS